VTASLLPLLERRLGALLAARPDLEPMVGVQGELLREVLTSARTPEVRLTIPEHSAALGKLRAGIPLLHEEALFLDLEYAADLFERLLNVVLRRGDADTTARAAPLIAAAADGRLDAGELFSAALSRQPDKVAAMAVSIEVDEDFLLSLASLAVAPQLRGLAARLSPVIEQLDEEVTWLRGYCPACGSPPLLGELRGVELRLFLRCAACGLAWRSRRIGCPFCATDDHHLLRALQVEGEHRFRVQVCDGCHGYLKIGNAFEPPPAELLPLDDLASIDLDIVALDHGYARPSDAGFNQ
jgi:FdhE protein